MSILAITRRDLREWVVESKTPAGWVPAGADPAAASRTRRTYSFDIEEGL